MPANRYSRYFTSVEPLMRHPAVKSYAPHIFNLLAVIIFTALVIRPTVATILQLRQDIQSKQQLLTQLDGKIQNLMAAHNSYIALGQDIKTKINRAIPDQADITPLVGDIQSTYSPITLSSIVASPSASASSSALPISVGPSDSTTALELQPVTVVTQKPIQYPLVLGTVEFAFSTHASYQTLLNILQELNKTPRLISLNSVVISKPEDSDSTVLSVDGKGYFLAH